MTQKYSNNFETTLNGAITTSSTTLTLTTVTGLPTLTTSDTCPLTLDNGTNVEIVKVTSINSTASTVDVTRAQESTSAIAFTGGTAVELRATADAIENVVRLSDEDRAVDLGGAESLEIPNSATPTVNAAGEIAVDTTITDHTGLITYHDGTEALYAVGIPTGNLSSTDGYVVAYNATNNEFEMVAQSGGTAGSTAFSDLTDITISTVDSADDTATFNNIRYLYSSDPVITNGGVTLKSSSNTTRMYTWRTISAAPRPHIIGNGSTEYIGFATSGPTLVNGSTNLIVTTTNTVFNNPIRPNGGVEFFTNTGIDDNSGNELLYFTVTGSAVNYLNVTNSATGNAPKLEVKGSDTNIDLDLITKGSGAISVNGSTAKIDTILDQDALSSDSATALATQQSIKAYVDAVQTSGTFTPTFDFSTTGDLSVAYTTQNGFWVKTGNIVYIEYVMTFTPTFTTASGTAYFGGLPEIGARQATLSTPAINSQFTWGASGTDIVMQIQASQTQAFITYQSSSANASALNAGNMTSGATHSIRFSGTYEIA